MAAAHNFNQFHEFLQNVFDQRAQKNANYSLRAFARDLKMSPSRVSEILRGASISVFSAKKVCSQLELAETESRYLVDLARSTVSRSSNVRERAKKRLASSQTQVDFPHLAPYETILSKWYHLVVAEYLTLASPLSPAAIQKRLGLSATDFTTSVELLSSWGVIKKAKNEKWTRSEPFTKAESPTRSSVIRRFHQAYLKIADHAISAKAVAERKAMTAVFSISRDDLENARADVEKFTTDFVKKYGHKQGGDAVFALGVQLYELNFAPDQTSLN